VVKKASKHTRTAAVEARPKMTRTPDDEEQILQAATVHLVRKHGGLLVATGLREEQGQGPRRWIITVTLRYPTGHEGYIGDLLYDGKDFSFLTPEDVRKERARQIAADPEGIRQWNEYRAATLRTGKA
jgi:hypothetical protein